MERLIYFRCANGAKVSTGPPKGSAMSVWPTGMSCPGGRSFSFVPGSCLRGVLKGAIVSAPALGRLAAERDLPLQARLSGVQAEMDRVRQSAGGFLACLFPGHPIK